MSAACRLSIMFPLILAFNPEVCPREGFVTDIQGIADRAATMIGGASPSVKKTILLVSESTKISLCDLQIELQD